MCKYCDECTRIFRDLYYRARYVLWSRPEHHGWQHALNVAELAVELSTEDVSNEHTPLIYVVGLLHDVSDHKFPQYVVDLKFILEIVSAELRSVIIQLTSAVSMSKEMTHGLDIPTEYLQVRHYVSDADKLLSLGRDGFIRMLEYSLDTYKHQTLDALVDELTQCVQRRMTRVPEFIRTKPGMERCSKYFNEFMICAKTILSC